MQECAFRRGEMHENDEVEVRVQSKNQHSVREVPLTVNFRIFSLIPSGIENLRFWTGGPHKMEVSDVRFSDPGRIRICSLKGRFLGPPWEVQKWDFVKAKCSNWMLH